MPYREKTAWLALISIVVAFVPYFAIVAARQTDGSSASDVRQLALFAVAAVAQVLILAVGTIILARTAPHDAQVPPDERDRSIVQRSTNIAYYVLISGVIVVGCVMPFTYSGWPIINAALLAIVIAEITRYGVVAVSYRRQA
ncbi:MAG TPA: hypothetical protein VEJ41_01815 [Candidatus Acidoferrales bacterium]|nr:hypothetical protein [Candidatus Acidoferrales bacterium]